MRYKGLNLHFTYLVTYLFPVPRFQSPRKA